MSDSLVTEAHTALVIAGFEAGKTDDEIIREIYETGAAFKNLRPIFNEVIASEGLRLSTKERKALTNKTLDGWSPESGENVVAQTVELAKILKITEPKALVAIRAWAKEAKVDLPKTERQARVLKVGFGGHIRSLLDFIMENREATREEIVAHCEAIDVPVKYAPFAMNIREFAGEFNPTADTDPAADTEAPVKTAKGKKAA